MNGVSDQSMRNAAKRGEWCKQMNVANGLVSCWKRDCIWGEMWPSNCFLQGCLGSSWRVIPAKFQIILHSIWSVNAYFVSRGYLLMYFIVESSWYKTWVARNHRITKKNHHHFTFDFWRRWTKKLELDFFRDGFPMCGRYFESEMCKNWKASIFKYF